MTALSDVLASCAKCIEVAEKECVRLAPIANDELQPWTVRDAARGASERAQLVADDYRALVRMLTAVAEWGGHK